MRVDDLGAGAHTPHDGWCDPNGLLWGFRRKAVELGAVYVAARVTGIVDERFIEAIDTVPTVLDALGLPEYEERVEGRSLLPLARGQTPESWGDAVFSELDYTFRPVRLILGRGPNECKAWMVRTAEWKYVHWLDYPPQLFTLRNDASEFFNLGGDPQHAATRSALHDRLCTWFGRQKRRTTLDYQQVQARTGTDKKEGVFYGVW